MSHGKIREDKTCLNCGHQVEERFCTHCGQENTEPKQVFHYLFTHFIEDFTHYDGQFWKTIKNLLFRPGKLTSIYLEGKRQLYVPPVKLYIFISFITFFMFSLFPLMNFGSNHKETAPTLHDKKKKDSINAITTARINGAIKKNNENVSKEDSATIAKINKTLAENAKATDLEDELNLDHGIDESTVISGARNAKEYDAIVAKNPSLGYNISSPFVHKFFELKESGITKKEIFKKLYEISFHNLPKALFIYLPVFALFLWFFHNKKKWWYFDHGVFTLHYFSFLLFVITIISILIHTQKLVNHIKVFDVLIDISYYVLALYSIGYFFIAHHRVYHSHGFVSFIIGFFLFFINFFAFCFLVVGLGLISFLMIH
ncbi:hypothetical protein IW15_18585 [Chryseobacterium soli]|uniref:DUF3667 domain-containing protein n=1 Tax=Chryseobacterium soli TaxID=445961 RepID=A0A086A1Z5_9FLAO|nr:DUF3667 domain-containing protein [Chryseobacterium soli]KFF10709.1 hypothetical protein IW15_18585 [Chryseobacterium soli]